MQFALSSLKLQACPDAHSNVAPSAPGVGRLYRPVSFFFRALRLSRFSCSLLLYVWFALSPCPLLEHKLQKGRLFCLIQRYLRVSSPWQNPCPHSMNWLSKRLRTQSRWNHPQSLGPSPELLRTNLPPLHGRATLCFLEGPRCHLPAN